MASVKQKLKGKLAGILGLENVVLFSSCRNALYALLLSLKLEAEDEVIVQDFICDSLPNAIKEAGGKPVLVGVNGETFNLDPRKVEEKINLNTKAIIFVHTYGNPSGIMEIKRLCEVHGLILIEDIAHALGASYGGKMAGSFGDYAVYSFTKQLVNFGGGALITNQDVDEVRKLRDELDRKPSFLGYVKRLMASLYETRAFYPSKIMIDLARKKADLKMTNDMDANFKCSIIEASIALKQIKSLKEKIRKRKRNFGYLKEFVKTQKIDSGGESSCNYLSFVFEGKEKRDEVVRGDSLFLPPWPGSSLSDKLVFVPNKPNFTKRRLNKFIKTYKGNDKDSIKIKNNEESEDVKKNYMGIKSKTIFLVLLSVIFLSITQILYKLASSSLSLSIQTLWNHYLIAGFFTVFVGGFLMLLALRKGDLSLIYPISALNYVLVGIMSHYFLQESMHLYKWFGLGIITLGVIITSKEGNR